MKNTFSFSPGSLTVNGWAYAAEYVEHDDGSVNIFVKLSKDDADRDALIFVPADDPRRAAIMAALHPETAPQALAIVPEETVQQPETSAEEASESPTPEGQPETSTNEMQDEFAPKETHGAVSEKPFIGTRIEGAGYSIFFNGEAGRTQIRFTSDASSRMIEAAKAAGFYYSKLTDTFNKRLTFKAYYAALALAASFNAV